MTEPNDRTPLDFTRALELAENGREVGPVRNSINGEFYVMVGGLPIYINSYGHSPSSPTGPQIVRNRVEEGCANCHGALGDLADGRDPEELCDTCYGHATATPAAPEPDGEVVGKRSDAELLRLIAADHERLAPNAYHSAETLRLIADRISTPPPPSSATPAEGMVGPSREQIDAWLEENCGKGLPHGEATNTAGMLHGLAYVLRQIEATSTYRPHIGQCNSATSALRMALDHFATQAIRTKSGSAGNVG